nr:hypothetical protein CFP56_57001 [Quercus suber]
MPSRRLQTQPYRYRNSRDSLKSLVLRCEMSRDCSGEPSASIELLLVGGPAASCSSRKTISGRGYQARADRQVGSWQVKKRVSISVARADVIFVANRNYRFRRTTDQVSMMQVYDMAPTSE